MNAAWMMPRTASAPTCLEARASTIGNSRMPPRLKEKLPMDSGIRDLEVPFQPSWLGDAVRDDGYVPDHVDEGLGEPEDLSDDRVVEGGGRNGGHSLEDADAGDRV